MCSANIFLCMVGGIARDLCSFVYIYIYIYICVDGSSSAIILIE